MIISLLSWIYILFICISIGVFINRLLSKIIPVPQTDEIGITGCAVTGLVSLTVYTEYFSIFHRISLLCHSIMIVFVLIGWLLYHSDIVSIFKKLYLRLFSMGGIIYWLIIIITSFYTSRGQFHTDTNLYHAQSIRILEEYGIIKGLGNFQLQFAYNSSYLVLCALFTMSFLLPISLHTMTGFLMVIFTCYSIDGLTGIRQHQWHTADMARLSIIIYTITNIAYAQSPATDYAAMYFSLYLICTWLSCSEQKSFFLNDKQHIYEYLAVLSIFVVSIKLSSAAVVILSFYPFLILLKEKKYRDTVLFITIGFLSFLPFMIRNVILSGWLFYPVESINLFSFAWKIPVEYLREDAEQIVVWGRCLYDTTLVNKPLSEWFPIWWDGQQIYGKMLMCSQLLGLAMLFLSAIIRLCKKQIRTTSVVIYISILASIAIWFFSAPFIRYGLAFLLAFPLCAIGDFYDIVIKDKVARTFLIASTVIFCLFSWFQNYLGDNIDFIQNYSGDDYYVWPIPFEDAQTDICDMNGATVYNSTKEIVNSYYYCPNTLYNAMMNRTELIGSTIEEGFKPKDNYTPE